MTHEYVFDYHDGDVYWCTADVGWVTGHSYIVYGPLANGATTLMFEGVPTYPDASRFWQVCEKAPVNQFYTAPTAIRALMGQGTEYVEKCDLSSLKVLGTVGEPINPEAWAWYHESSARAAARSSTPGGRPRPAATCITPLPGATPTKPGSATVPFFGVQPAVLEPQSGREITETKPPACSPSRTAGRARCAPSGAITTASRRPISSNTRAITSPVTAASATPTAITGSPGASMT